MMKHACADAPLSEAEMRILSTMADAAQEGYGEDYDDFFWGVDYVQVLCPGAGHCMDCIMAQGMQNYPWDSGKATQIHNYFVVLYCSAAVLQFC